MWKISTCKVFSPTWSGLSLRKMQTRLSKCSLAAGSFLFLRSCGKQPRNDSSEKLGQSICLLSRFKTWQGSSFLENQKEIGVCIVCWEKTKSASTKHRAQVRLDSGPSVNPEKTKPQNWWSPQLLPLNNKNAATLIASPGKGGWWQCHAGSLVAAAFKSFLWSESPFSSKGSLCQRSCKWGRRKDSEGWNGERGEGKNAELLCWNEGYRKTGRRALPQPINFSTRTAASSEVRMFPFSGAWGGGRGEAFPRGHACHSEAESDCPLSSGVPKGARWQPRKSRGQGRRSRWGRGGSELLAMRVCRWVGGTGVGSREEKGMRSRRGQTKSGKHQTGCGVRKL